MYKNFIPLNQFISERNLNFLENLDYSKQLFLTLIGSLIIVTIINPVANRISDIVILLLYC